jgi:hypothetical protein
METPDPDDPDTLAAWRDHGFDEPTARAWLTVVPGRFTQWTAPQWVAAGFGPADAGLWSCVFACPEAARAWRSAGFSDPYDTTENGG